MHEGPPISEAQGKPITPDDETFISFAERIDERKVAQDMKRLIEEGQRAEDMIYEHEFEPELIG